MLDHNGIETTQSSSKEFGLKNRSDDIKTNSQLFYDNPLILSSNPLLIPKTSTTMSATSLLETNPKLLEDQNLFKTSRSHDTITSTISPNDINTSLFETFSNNPSQEQQQQQLQQQLNYDQLENRCQAIGSSAYNCTSQDLYANIDFHPEEINFSEIQTLWWCKDWLDILIRVLLVAPIVLVGIIGNLTIIYSMYKFKPFRSKPTNIFILNMAIADLLTTMVCPNTALFTYIYQFYVLGPFICRLEGFIKITCLLVSSYSLIVLSSDWLLCVVQPCRKRITIKQSWIALIGIWISSVIFAAPLFMWRKLRERQWKDLVEVWCCELIQYSKYYWVVITLLMIYLPTIFMTIVLVIILAQMEKFEAKLRRSRTTKSDRSLSINMKYRRRIVKILIYYLLTSVICWTPLQVFIIYRHFQSHAIAANWFFELNFFTSLSASLTAATNPIIFGFLSQPFRRIVATSFMFRFFDKIMFKRSSNNNSGGGDQKRQQEIHAMKHQFNFPNNINNRNFAQSNRPDRARNNHDSTKDNHLMKHQAQIAAVNNSRQLNNSRKLQSKSLSRNESANRMTTSWQNNEQREAKIEKHHHNHFNDHQHNYQQPANKRVSFNTSVAERYIRKQESSYDNSKGHNNDGFIDTPETNITKSNKDVVNNKNNINHMLLIENRKKQQVGTTSFIQDTNDQSLRPMSVVSMDPIDIEENLGITTPSLDMNGLDDEVDEDGEFDDEV